MSGEQPSPQPIAHQPPTTEELRRIIWRWLVDSPLLASDACAMAAEEIAQRFGSPRADIVLLARKALEPFARASHFNEVKGERNDRLVLVTPTDSAWCGALVVGDLRRAADVHAQLSEPPPDQYLVWSNYHMAWWRPNNAGYAVRVEAAGRFSRAEAIASSRARDQRPDSSLPEIPVREADVLAVITSTRSPQ